jgi:hypothetical protein
MNTKSMMPQRQPERKVVPQPQVQPERKVVQQPPVQLQERQNLVIDAPNESLTKDEIVPGQIIIYTSNSNPIANELVNQIRNNLFAQASYIESMADVMERVNLPIRESVDYYLYLVKVPEGQEDSFCRTIELRYTELGGEGLSRDNFATIRFAAIPNPIFSASSTSAIASTIYHSADFSFNPIHSAYRDIIRADRVTTNLSNKACILILDSGIAEDVPFHVADRRNLIPDADSQGIDDFHHGTAIALLIHDVFPDVQIKSWKIMDSTGKVDGWIFQSAFYAESGADVVNISSVLRTKNRAMVNVLRKVITTYLKGHKAPVVVASTGNNSQKGFGFPACLPEIVAITSVSYLRRLSKFSNYGGLDVDGNLHKYFFALPGGENDANFFEAVMQVKYPPFNLWGTSFATPYASAIIAYYSQIFGPIDRQLFLTLLTKLTDRTLSQYTYEKYGNGILRFT